MTVMDVVLDKATNRVLDTIPCDEIMVTNLEEYWRKVGIEILFICRSGEDNANVVNPNTANAYPNVFPPLKLPPNGAQVKQSAAQFRNIEAILRQEYGVEKGF